jgi:hypothetical protein
MAAVADGCCSAARTDSASSSDMAERRKQEGTRIEADNDTNEHD